MPCRSIRLGCTRSAATLRWAGHLHGHWLPAEGHRCRARWAGRAAARLHRTADLRPARTISGVGGRGGEWWRRPREEERDDWGAVQSATRRSNRPDQRDAGDRPLLAAASWHRTQRLTSSARVQVHYVRCIKPNGKQSPVTFDPVAVAEQLRCQGILVSAPMATLALRRAVRLITMVSPLRIDWAEGRERALCHTSINGSHMTRSQEAIRIARASYPTRLAHPAFIAKYSVCLRLDRETPGRLLPAAAVDRVIGGGQPEQPPGRETLGGRVISLFSSGGTAPESAAAGSDAGEPSACFVCAS